MMGSESAKRPVFLALWMMLVVVSCEIDTVQPNDEVVVATTRGDTTTAGDTDAQSRPVDDVVERADALRDEGDDEDGVDDDGREDTLDTVPNQDSTAIDAEVLAPCPCGRDEWCDYPDDLCGMGAPGVCRRQPNTCLAGGWPVCSCEGRILSHICNANGSGFDISVQAICDADAFFGPERDPRFQCGPRFCFLGLQYCEHRPAEQSGTDTFSAYRCVSLPTACDELEGDEARSCECLAEEPCGDVCSILEASGQPMLTCLSL